MAACVQDMFCNINLVKKHKIASNSTVTEAREKNENISGILGI
jgi:hypothetical protein